MPQDVPEVTVVEPSWALRLFRELSNRHQHSFIDTFAPMLRYSVTPLHHRSRSFRPCTEAVDDDWFTPPPLGESVWSRKGEAR